MLFSYVLVFIVAVSVVSTKKYPLSVPVRISQPSVASTIASSSSSVRPVPVSKRYPISLPQKAPQQRTNPSVMLADAEVSASPKSIPSEILTVAEVLAPLTQSIPSAIPTDAQKKYPISLPQKQPQPWRTSIAYTISSTVTPKSTKEIVLEKENEILNIIASTSQGLDASAIQRERVGELISELSELGQGTNPVPLKDGRLYGLFDVSFVGTG